MFHDSWPNRPLTSKERVGHNDGGLKFATLKNLKTRSTRGLWSAFQSFAKAAKAHHPVSATEPPRSRQPDLLQAWACSLPTRTLETLMNYIIYHHIIISSYYIKYHQTTSFCQGKFWINLFKVLSHGNPTSGRALGSNRPTSLYEHFKHLWQFWTRSWPWPAPSMRHHLATQKNFYWKYWNDKCFSRPLHIPQDPESKGGFTVYTSHCGFTLATIVLRGSLRHI